MANAIKYSTSPQTLALKKGNYWIGTGDVGKGPTSGTDYWHGITPPVSGYTVYVNKVSEGPSIRVANTDAELITITNQIAAQSYTSVTQCFNYFQTQSDKMVFQRDYESIITDGLVFNLDAGFLPSYPQSGTTWYDLGGNGYNGTLTNGPTFNSSDGGSIVFDGTDDYAITSNTNYDFSTNANFTYCAWIYPSFSSTSNTGRAVIDFTGAGPGFLRSYLRWEGFSSNLGFYFDIASGGGSAWNTGVIPKFSANTWHHLCFVHNSSNVGTFYFDGVAVSTVNGVANSATVTNNKITIGYGAVNSYYWAGDISNVLIYNKALSSSEVLQNYLAQIPRYGFDPNAQNFITNAGITGSTEQNAINELVLDLKEYNLWSKMKFIYPFVGGTSTTCKYNLINPDDTDAAYRLIFNGGLTFSSSGMTGAVNGYADTKLAPASAFSDFIQSYGVYLLENSNTYYNELGVRPSAGVNSQIAILPRHTGTFFGDLTFQRRITTPSSDSRGFFCISRTSTTDFRLYRNGSQVGATNTSTLSILNSTVNINIWLSGMNLNGSLDGPSPRTKAFAYASTGLNSTEIANLYTAVQAFQTSLSRQV